MRRTKPPKNLVDVLENTLGLSPSKPTDSLKKSLGTFQAILPLLSKTFLPLKEGFLEINFVEREYCVHAHAQGEAPSIPRRKIIPPKLEWVVEYCEKRDNGIDPEKFFNWYEGTEWCRGKVKLKDWESAVRYWERTETPRGQSKRPSYGSGGRDKANKRKFKKFDLED